MRAIDKNNDGFIQYAEFVNWFDRGDRDAWAEVRGLCSKKLRITIRKASHLCPPKGGLVLDPFCTCEFQGRPRSRIQTPTAVGAISPHWNYEFEMPDIATARALVFTVQDEDTWPRPTIKLGEAVLPREQYQSSGFSGNLPLENDGEIIKASLEVRVEILGTAMQVCKTAAIERPALASTLPQLTPKAPEKLPRQQVNAAQPVDPHPPAGKPSFAMTAPLPPSADAKDLAQLQEMFPGWDAGTLQDMLLAKNGDLDATAHQLLQWTGDVTPDVSSSLESWEPNQQLDPASPWHGARLKNMPATPSSSSRSGILKPLARPQYDSFMAERLVRKCGGRMLAGIVKAACLFRRHNEAAGLVDSACLTPAPLASTRGRELSDASSHSGRSKLPKRECLILEGNELLRQRCVFLSFRLVEMQDDGNCQFRALSHELYGTQKHHERVREIVVRHLRNHASEYSPLFGDGEWPAYLTSMSRSRTWGDELTLRAAADAFEVRIHVITSTAENWYLVYHPESFTEVDASSCMRELFLTYLAPIHYNVVEPSR